MEGFLIKVCVTFRRKTRSNLNFRNKKNSGSHELKLGNEQGKLLQRKSGLNFCIFQIEELTFKSTFNSIQSKAVVTW